MTKVTKFRENLDIDMLYHKNVVLFSMHNITDISDI